MLDLCFKLKLVAAEIHMQIKLVFVFYSEQDTKNN